MGTPNRETPATHVALRYLYRDAGNSKQQGRIVVRARAAEDAGAAAITETELRDGERAIRAACDSGEYFLPEQIGLPTLHFEGARTEDDHDFHEFLGLELCAGEAAGHPGEGTGTATDPAVPAQATLPALIAAFQAAARSGWRLRSWH